MSEEARRANGNLPGMGGVYNVVNLHLYHYAGNNPIKYTDPDGREAKVSRWLKRNWNEMLGLGFSAVEIGLGIAGSGYTLGLSNLMVVHGAANASATILKMTITTADAIINGDDSADRLDKALPTSAIGLVSYAMGALAENLAGAESGKFAEMMGAWGDVIDIGVGLGLGAGMKKDLAKALEGLSGDQVSNVMKIVGYSQNNMAAKGIMGLAEHVMDFMTVQDTANKTQVWHENPY